MKSNQMFGYLIITSWVVLEVIHCESQAKKKEFPWKQIFPTDYDKYIAPVVNGDPVIVYVNLQIMDIDEIREETMDFRMQVYITEIWKDLRLNFTILNITSSRKIPDYSVGEMWLPDIVFDNSKWGQLFQFSLPNTVVKVRSDHSIHRITRYSFVVQCPMILRDFPLDIQECCFKMAFLATSEEFGKLHWSGEEDSPYKHLGESIILTEDIQPLKYEIAIPVPCRLTEIWVDGNFSYLIANFTFFRRLTGNIINVYVPSTLVVSMTWLSFWLDVNAVPARITLGVTSILTLVTQVVQSRTFTPPVNYVKALDIWLFLCISSVTASLIEYGIAYQYSRHCNEKTQASEVLKNTTKEDVTRITKRDASVKWISSRSAFQDNKQQNSKGKSNSSKSEANNLKNRIWMYLFPQNANNYFDFYCRFLFPFIFVVFAVGYWIYYLNRRNSYSKAKGIVK